MGLTFTDEELEKYFRLRAEADAYLNTIIRLKRAEQYIEWKKENDK